MGLPIRFWVDRQSSNVRAPQTAPHSVLKSESLKFNRAIFAIVQTMRKLCSIHPRPLLIESMTGPNGLLAKPTWQVFRTPCHQVIHRDTVSHKNGVNLVNG